MSIRRRRALIVTAAILGLFAAGISLTLLSAHRKATAAFERHGAEIRQRLAETRRPVSRPPVLDPALRENGGDYYAVAIKEVGQVSQAEQAWTNSGGLPTGEARVLRTKHQVLLQALRNAVRCETVVIPEDYESGRLRWSKPPGPWNLQAAVNLLGRIAIAHHAAHEEVEAYEALLIALAVCADHVRAADVTSAHWWHSIETALTALWIRMLTNHALTAADLERLAKSLDRLSAGRPEVGENLRLEDLVQRATLLLSERDSLKYLVFEHEPSWRFLWSPRLAGAAGLDSLQAAFAELEAGDD